MANGLLVLILMLCALAAILAGVSVFSNSRPPDPRLNQTLDDLDEIKGILNQLQKSLLQMERKIEKDQKEGRSELKEVLEKVGERIDQRIATLAE